MRTKRKILLLLQFLLSGGLLYWVFSGVDWNVFFHTVAGADLRYMVAAFVLMQANALLQGARLHIVLQQAGIDRGLGKTVAAYWVGLFHDIYLPANIGGDAFRVWRLGGRDDLLSVASGLLALRVQGALGILAIGCFGAATYFMPTAGGYCAAFAAVGAGVLVLRLLYSRFVAGDAEGDPPPNLSRLARIFEGMMLFARNRNVFLASYGVHILFVLSTCAIYGLMFRAFSVSVPFVDLCVGIPVIMFVSMLPVSIQGRGVTEWLACFFWAGVYGSKEQLVAGCLTIYFLLIAQGLLSGLVWLARSGSSALEIGKKR
ncbi:lysylphosphatidylglycerol synthase transmembrane domain-containing protein [Pseudodesulfovibrio senegalensis]|uniref:Flippase-like domain-containing protein n=1 Tax=Pseudodesulfovibrio senegalensis TaxID=1721087 RepID=A0A6N6N301_9BACT|nr:lysylphosphatidylglycerol synthase transmembrane domain-containing protein [Pseudodesulfovibrio senegalensis]KAB1442092.1 flippase-like domain-containing protein [Pseudodesulfovibrio senegalensis]